MAKYRHKERGWILNAVQWYAMVERDDIVSASRTTGVLLTSEGKKTIRAGDWLVDGPDGITYKISDEDFREHFETLDGTFVPHIPAREQALAEERKRGENALVENVAIGLRDALREGKHVSIEPAELTEDDPAGSAA